LNVAFFPKVSHSLPLGIFGQERGSYPSFIRTLQITALAFALRPMGKLWLKKIVSEAVFNDVSLSNKIIESIENFWQSFYFIYKKEK